MKKIILLFCVLVCFVGCKSLGLQVPPSVCDGIAPGESVLCDIAKEHDVHLETIGNLIAFENIDAIERGDYLPNEAIQFLNNLKLNIEFMDGITTMDLAKTAREKLGRRGAIGYLLLSPYIGFLDMPKILKSTDKELLFKWIDQNIKILME